MAAVGQQPQLQPTKQNEKSKPAVTQLEFHQAMTDFKTMFPDMDEDVIEVVLRANNGAVDSTIDQLLAMQTDNENERLRAELDATENDELPPSYSPATPPPSYHQAVPYAHSPGRLAAVQLGRKVSGVSPSLMRHTQLLNQKSTPAQQLPIVVPKIAPPQKNEVSNTKVETATSQPKKKWNPPLVGPLPSSFLRLEDHHQQKSRRGKFMTLSTVMLQKRMLENERQRRNTIGAEDPELARYLEDERIALFLQNEEFVRELMGNKEFLSTLEKDSASNGTMTLQTKHSHSSRNNERSSGGAESSKAEDHPQLPHSFSADETDAAFRERLKNMGKLSRRKFAQLASIFSRRKRAFKPILGDGINPSRDNLLLHEDEYSELSEDDSDTDWNKKDSWDSHHGDLNEKPPMKNSHKHEHS
ncbi:CUE domain-containing protein 1 [Trichonephila inaurata madagascariensis]|uniref:CUE domain-containing protein 1 n=1 Tax=Trichonephila inaurata madagascariensis TaxID=2747483 RepID=A0A8X7BXW4_9ARAC|nr:CUE domain-containing protein 1 [Trichonephila inaurata madagascariensis]